MAQVVSINTKISVIIPTFNRINKLKTCLNLVFKQIRKTDEVIVVDNASSDNTLILLKSLSKKHKNLKSYKTTKKGPSYGRNMAINRSSGKILVFLDDDSFISKNFIKEVLIVCSKPNLINKSSVYQGRIRHKFETENIISKMFYARIKTDRKLQYYNNKDWRDQKIVHHINACNFFLRKEVLEYLDFVFDEKIFPFVGEERDLAERLQLAGVKIRFSNKTKIIHSKATATLQRFIGRAYADGKAEAILLIKYLAPKWKIKLFLKDNINPDYGINYITKWQESLKYLNDENILTKIQIWFLVMLHITIFYAGFYKVKLLNK